METHHKKITKLIDLLKTLVHHLDSSSDLRVHNNIDQFFYMTKVEELKLLLAEYEEQEKALKTTAGRLEMKYVEIYHHWRKSVRFLNTHLYVGEYARH